MTLEIFLALPVLAALAAFFMQGQNSRRFATAVAAVQTLIGLGLATAGNIENLSTKIAWIPALGLNWSLGLDGANVLLVVLTPLLTTLAMLTLSAELEKSGSYPAHLLLLNAMLCGVFLAQNLGLFYIFFEAMLIPALFIVVGWSKRDGQKTALKFLMFTLAGSLPMLLGVLILAFGGSGSSLEFEALNNVPADRQLFLFFPFLLAFAVKMPLVPFHGWLGPLYKNAPASSMVLIAAFMSKAGTYGLLKVGLEVFPKALSETHGYIIALAVLTVIYGALSALGSNSIKETLAFSSLSHIAMIALGIASLTAAGAAGAGLQMAGHSIATGGLFLAVAMLERRELPDELRRFGGLAKMAPKMTVMFLFLVLAALGQPGMGSFPGELLILTGLYSVSPQAALAATLGIMLAAAYLLRWYQVIFTGESGTIRKPRDLDRVERLVLLVPICLTLLMGLAPSLFLEPIQAWLGGVL